MDQRLRQQGALAHDAQAHMQRVRRNGGGDEAAAVVADLEARLIAYAKQQKPSEWLKAQPSFLGPQGVTAFDPGFDISDGGVPQEKPVLPKE